MPRSRHEDRTAPASSQAVWDGWQAAVLAAAGVPYTRQDELFLSEWHAAEQAACPNNPLDATRHASGSKNCKHVAGDVHAQSYRSHASGAQATAAQLHEQPAAAILKALHSGNPFTYRDWQEVVGSLATWGAHTFAAEYTTAMEPSHAKDHAAAVAASDATRSLRTWHHLSQVLAHDAPKRLYRARKLNREALAAIHRHG